MSNLSDKHLENLALHGDLEAAIELAQREVNLSVTTNLDAMPEAQEAYEIERARLLAQD